MKKEQLYKDFLPISYSIDKNKKESMGDKRGLVLLIILFISLFPSTIKNIYPNKHIILPASTSKDSGYKKADINKWINIAQEGIQGEIKSNQCSLVVNNKELLNELTKNEIFTINTIEFLGDNKYRVNIKKG